MGRTGLNSWLQLVHGLHIWLSQSELLLWIQMWIQNPPIFGKIQSTWICLVHTCNFPVSQQLPCFRTWYVLMWKYIGQPSKGPGDRQVVLLQWFLVIDLDLSLKVRYVKLEMKVLVDDMFCDMIAGLPCTENGIIKKKKAAEVSGFLNCTTYFSIFWLIYCVVTVL